VNAEPWLTLLLWIAAGWAVVALINRAWRWLTRPRRIITKARLYKWPDAKRRER
jgi:hypothetical protein